LSGMEPAAVVMADQDADAELVSAINRHVEALGPYVPVLARVSESSYGASVLPITADAAPFRLVARLTSALRIRALHATVQRRVAAQARQDVGSPYGEGDAVTVLVAGRGGGYPALTLAVSEHCALIGALSLETAKRYLDGRDIDGIL